ncbi:hypothetical protein Salat_0938200 [Sesamum alatum]|uniref:Pentatricopeptide repeat-containing protein n=1 Tax=Sesamum alatum TaxID=300844 RepID=A0AAE1YL56_9LAMI|nr:hypothetical protein Salat_0938200 [Sesamum alatum]
MLNSTSKLRCFSALSTRTKIAFGVRLIEIFSSSTAASLGMPLHWPGLWTAQPWQFQSNWVFSTLQIRLSQGPQELRSANKKITELIRGGQLEDARALFDTLSQRNTVTWNSMLSGDSGSGGSTRFKRNVVTWNSMIMSYVKAGDMASARELFNQTEILDSTKGGLSRCHMS